MIGAAIAMMATASIVGVETVASTFASDGFEKIEAQKRALGRIAEHPFLGVGRGAFGATIAPTLDPAQRYLHAESFVVQWAAEWGLPFAAFLFAAIAFALGGVLRRAQSPQRIAAVVAIGALGLQNLVDFGLEMVGEAVVVAAVAGAIVRDRGGSRPGAAAKPSIGPSHRRLGAFIVGSGLACLALFAPSVTRGIALERQVEIETALARGEHAEVRALSSEAIRLHPLDAGLYVLAGASEVAKGDPSAARLLNRAMEIAPLWSTPHHVASAMLASRGRLVQALLELREAEERTPGSAVEPACNLLQVSTD
ncbi:MAG: O-antigen ligase family protein, partial [Polyangiaceae bacterium]|nr:O-antigen ligase family protein [Polyangiaceae bacterium]